MPCKIHLRNDQNLSLRQKYSSKDVTVFAPSWVKQALQHLQTHLKGITFELYQKSESSQSSLVERFKIPQNFNNQSLILLQKIARNESQNTTGIINLSLYQDIRDNSILFSLRDLVRQCIIVGVDTCSTYGGYGCPRGTQPNKRVYICDLSALQFQQPFNSGRLVLIQKNERYEGLLDNFIYENVVGERKRSYQDVLKLWNQSGPESVLIKRRYWHRDGFGGSGGTNPCFIDTQAYFKFVKADVLLCGKALCKIVKRCHPSDKIHWKFLKYGTGFYGGKFASDLDYLILYGVLDGMEELMKIEDVPKIIKCVEFPFFKRDDKSERRIERLKYLYKIDIVFSEKDALKESHHKGLIVCTTNCGDCHAPIGNEMEFQSVDAAIAENLTSKGHIFCPNINQQMSEEYIDI